jgi:hypothetical protein
MSEVRILLRWCLLVTVGLVLMTCSSASGTSGGSTFRGGNPCSKGEGAMDRNAPIVCVDDTAAILSVNPDPVRINSVGESDRQAVVIHWWTKSGGNALNLEIQPGCVTDVTCEGSHCKARTLPVTTRTRCKYDVWTDKHPKLDPEVEVDPCC